MLIKRTYEDRINRHIRERIKEARTQRGMSQEDIARYLEKSRVAISDLERGRAQINASDLASIAAFLEKPITYFFPAVVVGADASGLTPKEKELIHFFRQLGHEALENVALNQVRTLADEAAKTFFEQSGHDAQEEKPE